MTYVCTSVQPMANAISRLQTFHGDAIDTSILIAKAIIKGARTYEQLNTVAPYTTGSVNARRAEGILIQQELQGTLIESKNQSARSIGKKILPLEVIAEFSEKEFENKSHIFDLVLAYVGTETEKQRTQLAKFGKEVSSRLTSATHYITPEEVDISRLRSPSLAVKTVYRELNKLRNIIETI